LPSLLNLKGGGSIVYVPTHPRQDLEQEAQDKENTEEKQDGTSSEDEQVAGTDEPTSHIRETLQRVSCCTDDQHNEGHRNEGKAHYHGGKDFEEIVDHMVSWSFGMD